MLVGVDASRVTRPRRTGTENYSLHVLRGMMRLDPEQRFRLYLSQPLPDGLLPIGRNTDSRLIRLPRLWTHVGLSREMLRDPPDVLFVPSHVLPIVTPRRSVAVVYDVGHRFFPRVHGLAEWLYVEWAIRRHVRVAAEILTISEQSRRDLARLYGADPRRVTVAYPAVDAAFHVPSGEEVARVRQRYTLGSAPYVLHLGTLKPRKNLPRLVRAFAAARLPVDTTLVLAGATSFGTRELHQAILDAGLGQRVRLLSYVDQADLPALYGGAACVAIVSVYEGFGMPALEALACGAPVVASRRGSLPEIVSGAAELVDPLEVGSIAEGLSRVAGDASVADRLREAGPPRARQFTWDAAATTALEVIRRAGQQARR